jgi:hypothetical protein
MRGEQESQVGLLTLTSPGKRVPVTHSIREITRLAGDALPRLDGLFEAMYSSIGRPSITPERLLKAQLLIALYSVRSERQFASGWTTICCLLLPRHESGRRGLGCDDVHQES